MNRKQYTPSEMSEIVGLGIRRLQQIAPELIEKGHAFKFGNQYGFYESAIEHINNRPDGRKK